MRRTLTRGPALVLLVAYLVVVATIVFAPDANVATAAVAEISAWLLRLGAPGWVAGPPVEFVTNVLLFVPLTYLGAALRPRWSIRRWVFVGLACTCLVEATQWLLLPGRSAQVTDVVANTLGASLGALLAWLVRGRAR